MLVKHYRDQKWKLEDIADKMGYTKSWVSELLQISEHPEMIQKISQGLVSLREAHQEVQRAEQPVENLEGGPTAGEEAQSGRAPSGTVQTEEIKSKERMKRPSRSSSRGATLKSEVERASKKTGVPIQKIEKLAEEIVGEAVGLLGMTEAKGAGLGKSPVVLATVLLYLACQRNNLIVPQEELAAVAGITPVSLRNRTKELCVTLGFPYNPIAKPRRQIAGWKTLLKQSLDEIPYLIGHEITVPEILSHPPDACAECKNSSNPG